MPGNLILVVDDDRDLGAVLKELIETLGYDVRVVTTVEEASAALRDEPALVLLDWYLPDGPPTELARRLRERDIPVVLSSACDGQDDRAAAVGAAATLGKPFDIDTLSALIERLLGRTAPATYS
jgi:two-component system response regulator CpxR